MSGFPFTPDPRLTGLVIAHRNAALIADRVLPRLGMPVPTRQFRYLKFDFSQGITIPDTKVGRKGTPNQVEFYATEVADQVEDYGLSDVIPNDDVTNAPTGYDPRDFAATKLIELVDLDREVRVANVVFDAATYPSGNKETLSGTSQWDDPDSTPIEDVQDAMDAMIMRPNKLVLGRPVWTRLRRHPKIIAAISTSGTESGVATLTAVADLLEIPEIVVGDAWVNTAKKGQTVTRTRAWGKHAALLHVPASLSSTTDGTPAFGYTAVYGTRVSGETPAKVGLRGGVEITSGESVAEVIASSELGHLFTNAVS
ncbi:major capsid protein [Methylobrevis pamukkalensis]|uniref:Phage capsid family protein n=1 Tax=Methylobrevis pamukkalensis TaxID=1439726 RepID=A0A1E3H4E1_9HYPH|nr:major capsid protein [Methylobrevis pamukkalensis]ODN71180.1 hypothetical protein A6302_01469 [Methylobrevis pamukkalensis]